MTYRRRVGYSVTCLLNVRQQFDGTAPASVNRRDGKAPMTIVIVMIVVAFLLCASTVRSK